MRTTSQRMASPSNGSPATSLTLMVIRPEAFEGAALGPCRMALGRLACRVCGGEMGLATSSHAARLRPGEVGLLIAALPTSTSCRLGMAFSTST